MSIPKWLREHINDYPETPQGWKQWVDDCVLACGVTRKAVAVQSYKMWKRISGKIEGRSVLPGTVPQSKSMNRSGFLSKYDVNTRTREALRRGIKTLKEAEDPADDEILEDPSFRQERCDDVSLQAYRAVANEDEFIRYQFRIGDKVMWTTPRQRQWAIDNVTKARPL